jgi:hypothetical protein
VSINDRAIKGLADMKAPYCEKIKKVKFSSKIDDILIGRE